MDGSQTEKSGLPQKLNSESESRANNGAMLRNAANKPSVIPTPRDTIGDVLDNVEDTLNMWTTPGVEAGDPQRWDHSM